MMIFKIMMIFNI